MKIQKKSTMNFSNMNSNIKQKVREHLQNIKVRERSARTSFSKKMLISVIVNFSLFERTMKKKSSLKCSLIYVLITFSILTFRIF